MNFLPLQSGRQRAETVDDTNTEKLLLMRSRTTAGRPTHARVACLTVLVAGLWLSTPGALAGTTATATPPETASADRLQRLVDELRQLLAIEQAVVASVVTDNPLLVSVAARPGHPFMLAVEQGFLEALDGDEVRAVVAHELGHVWIFTHHPYLQTEALANQVALRAVSRESLERVYEKVWARGGSKGTLARFMGD